ncbi:MAG: YkgJ family cysteine cluster protein [Candidatus Hodarchaeales archaeon]
MTAMKPIHQIHILKEALESPIIIDFSQKSPFSNFSCISGCKECCGYAYYLPSEVWDLPKSIQDQLIEKNDGKYEIRLTKKRCVFYNSKKAYYCTIYNVRPLRCKIFPYFPVIVERRVIITLEPALRMINYQVQRDTCPGIGKRGKPLTTTIDECLSFLCKLDEVPRLLTTVILDSDSFNKIRNDRWFIEND